MFYDFLLEIYGENEPILVSEIQYENMSINYIRQQIKRLVDIGRLKRYDTGIYYIPKKSIFKSGSVPEFSKVVKKKYLMEQDVRCGYIGGIAFANQLMLTTQVPNVCEIVTNKASKDYRETTLGSERVIIRKPRVKITEENYQILRFLDLIKDIDIVAEVTEKELSERILLYMKKIAINFYDLQPYLNYYPDKIYKNLYEVGLLNGISA